jgi:hypothetical protein
MRDIESGRILGAVRFVDASTGARIERPLQVEPGDLRLLRNRSGDYAIVGANHTELAKHIAAFETAPAQPGAETVSFTLRVKDPGAEFLPAAFTVKLPRQSDPAKAAQEDSIFRPIEVRLYSSPMRPIDSNWCAVRASVRTTQGAAVVGAGLKLTRADDATQVYFGVTGADGEVLIAVAGLPFLFVSAGGGGGGGGGSPQPVIETKTSGTLQVFLHSDGVAVTPDMMRANDDKLVDKGSAPVDLAASTSVHKNFTVNP